MAHLNEQAQKSRAVRIAVYEELKERRQKLIERRYKAGQSAFTAMSEVAMLTDVEVLEELNYHRNAVQ